jgi:LysR family transcriptional regulator, low CO2-responsive transcriptional regulator
MNYTISQLQIFDAVVENKSITRASNLLCLSQPAVSIQLKKFQEQFKFPLIEQKGRSIRITDFGYEISQIVRLILQDLGKLQLKTQEFAGLLKGKLKISTASTGKYVIPFFLTDFLAKNNDIDLSLDVTNKAKVVKSLRQNEIDLAVVSTLPSDLEVEEELLIQNKLYLLGTIANKASKMPLIYRENGSATRYEMEKYFSNQTDIFKKKIELTSNESVKQAVIAGIGHSILPIIGVRNELLNQSLTIIQRNDLPIITTWRIIWLKNKKHSPASEAFLGYIKKNKQQIIERYFQGYQTD